MTDFLERREKLKNVLYERTPDYFMNYCISREGDLSEQDIIITRCNNKSDVGANKEYMADLDEKIAILALKDLDNSEINANFALNMTSHASR